MSTTNDTTVPRTETSAQPSPGSEVLQKLRTEPTISVADAAVVFGVGRSTAYAAAQNDWPVVKVRSRVRVPSAWVLAQLGLNSEVPA